MITRFKRHLGVVSAVALYLTGCATNDHHHPELEGQPTTTTTRTIVKTQSEPVEKGGEKIRYYPVDNKSMATIAISKEGPNNIRLGKPFDYTITVENISDQTLANVMVKERISDSFELMETMPEGTYSDTERVLDWDVGMLKPAEAKTMKVTGKAVSENAFKNCASVTYDQYLCMHFGVTDPKLQIKKTMPAEAMLGDTFPVNLVVSNPGSGVAEDIVITDNLPEGLVTTNGNRMVKIKAGDLGPKKQKETSFMATAERTGTFVNKVLAESGELSAHDQATIVVRQPQLAIVKTGTSRQISGRNIDYTIEVTNVGDGNAEHTLLRDPVPAGTEFVSASHNGTLNGNVISWDLGTLTPEQRKTVTARVRALRAGTIQNVATAKATRADEVSDDAVTKIVGVSAVLLEVIDTLDPIEIGQTCQFVVKVTNQGFAKDTNIRIRMELEQPVDYLSASGPTDATVNGKVITFGALAELDPKESATWTVSVKGVQAADVRTKVEMETDQLKRPVMETEATTIY